MLDVDHGRNTVTVGPREALLVRTLTLDNFAPATDDGGVAGRVLVQCSAHGPVRAGRLAGTNLVWDQPQIRVAPGQSVVFYDPEAPDEVLGGALVVAST